MVEVRKVTRARAAEAKTWFDRLNKMSVSVADVQGYFHWARDPANALAYRRAEKRGRKAAEGPPFSEKQLLRTLKRRPDLAAQYQAASRT